MRPALPLFLALFPLSCSVSVDSAQAEADGQEVPQDRQFGAPMRESEVVDAGSTPKSEQLTASWAAVVSKSEGLALEPGTPCDILATFQVLAGTVEFLELQVQCAGLPLYRLSDELNGLSMTSATLGVKEDDETGVSQYWLKFDDVGSRTGARNQVTIDTPGKTASVWKETAPKFQVDLAVEKWTGTPVQTDAGDASPGD